GPGGGPHVRAFDGVTGQPISSFFAYDPSFRGGVNVASGDFDGNKVPDLITGPASSGGPHIRVWTNSPTPALVSEFLAFGGAGNQGVNVGSVSRTDNNPDLIAVSPRPLPTDGPTASHTFATYDLHGVLAGTRIFGGVSSNNLPMSSNPDAPAVAFAG